MTFSETEHLIKIINNLEIKWSMVLNQMEHLIKMTNDF
jgi:hypothetical protein